MATNPDLVMKRQFGFDSGIGWKIALIIIGLGWLIPKEAKKPLNGRLKTHKKRNGADEIE